MLIKVVKGAAEGFKQSRILEPLNQDFELPNLT